MQLITRPGQRPGRVPPRLRAPGAKVTVIRVPVTIEHGDCDLTSVSIKIHGGIGADVPDSAGGVTGIADPAPGGCSLAAILGG